MSERRTFSRHVYDLAEQTALLAEIAAKSKAYVNRPPALEVVWVLPHDADSPNWSDPSVLFDLPVVRADVDRPYLALRPTSASDGTDRSIRPGAQQAMAQHDWDRDGPYAGWPLP